MWPSLGVPGKWSNARRDEPERALVFKEGEANSGHSKEVSEEESKTSEGGCKSHCVPPRQLSPEKGIQGRGRRGVTTC